MKQKVKLWTVSLCFISLCLTGCSSDRLKYKKVDYKDISGWQEDNFLEALPAFKRSCSALDFKQKYPRFCANIMTLSFEDNDAFRSFLEENLTPYRLTYKDRTEGTITGYYEAELTGSLTRQKPFQVPIYGLPEDVDEQEKTRQEIEEESLEAPILAWADDPVDVFILHIQGSGRLKTPDGKEILLGYAGNNGHKFKGIGTILKEEGLLGAGMGNMPSIRTWLKANPQKAYTLMQKNPRYIYFRYLYNESPIGSAGVVLTPERSIAVDTNYLTLNSPLFMQFKNSKGQLVQKLVIASDTGADIKGPLRADYFWGHGEDAFQEAGRLKSKGRFFALCPKN